MCCQQADCWPHAFNRLTIFGKYPKVVYESIKGHIFHRCQVLVYIAPVLLIISHKMELVKESAYTTPLFSVLTQPSMWNAISSKSCLPISTVSTKIPQLRATAFQYDVNNLREDLILILFIKNKTIDKK